MTCIGFWHVKVKAVLELQSACDVAVFNRVNVVG